MAKKKWIAGAIKRPGALHKELGVPEGEKIPESKLTKAAKAPGTEGLRARLAQTLKGFHHKGRKAPEHVRSRIHAAMKHHRK